MLPWRPQLPAYTLYLIGLAINHPILNDPNWSEFFAPVWTLTDALERSPPCHLDLLLSLHIPLLLGSHEPYSLFSNVTSDVSPVRAGICVWRMHYSSPQF